MKLKRRMSFQEMSQHMIENTSKIANRVTVGMYAKKLGYQVYKPMIDGKIRHYYVNDTINEESEN